MKNKRLIDHILICVSKKEFKYWMDLSKTDKRVYYKEVKSDEHSWRGIYLQFESNYYLEIIEKSAYPARVGMAVSSLGQERYLFKELKESYPNSKMELHKTLVKGKPWYDGIYCEEMESKTSILWFMHYRGHHRKKRGNYYKRHPFTNRQKFTLVLTPKELADYIEKVKFCGLKVLKKKDIYLVQDELNRSFQLVAQERPQKRVIFNHV